IRYRPSVSETVARVSLVAMFLAETETPGSTPLLVSLIVPVRFALDDCANEEEGTRDRITTRVPNNFGMTTSGTLQKTRKTRPALITESIAAVNEALNCPGDGALMSRSIFLAGVRDVIVPTLVSVCSGRALPDLDADLERSGACGTDLAALARSHRLAPRRSRVVRRPHRRRRSRRDESLDHLRRHRVGRRVQERQQWRHLDAGVRSRCDGAVDRRHRHRAV